VTNSTGDELTAHRTIGNLYASNEEQNGKESDLILRFFAVNRDAFASACDLFVYELIAKPIICGILQKTYS
jgi:hypothetical protein